MQAAKDAENISIILEGTIPININIDIKIRMIPVYKVKFLYIF